MTEKKEGGEMTEEKERYRLVRIIKTGDWTESRTSRLLHFEAGDIYAGHDSLRLTWLGKAEKTEIEVQVDDFPPFYRHPLNFSEPYKCRYTNELYFKGAAAQFDFERSFEAEAKIKYFPATPDDDPAQAYAAYEDKVPLVATQKVIEKILKDSQSEEEAKEALIIFARSRLRRVIDKNKPLPNIVFEISDLAPNYIPIESKREET